MLKYRILTALVLIPLVLAGIFLLKPEHFKWIAGVIFLLAGIEWSRILSPRWVFTIFFNLVLMGAMLSFIVWGQAFTKYALSSAIVGWIFVILSLFFYKSPEQNWFQCRVLQTAFGWFALFLAWLGLCVTQGQPLGGYLVISLLLLIWATDTFAYFVGRKWGKTKLSKISPGKSVEGVIGGVLGSLTTGLVIFWGWHQYDTQCTHTIFNQIAPWVGVVLLISVLSVCGDLFESMLKRIYGVKDSGKCLPGHGGLLDRIDSLLPTLPIYALLMFYL